MKITDKDIHALMSLMESTGLIDIELETPEMSLVLSRNLREITARTSAESRSEGGAGPAPGKTISAPAVTPRREAPTPQRVPDPFADERFATVKAPMLGTFYRAPSPGAEPFVEKGASVKEDDTLCIIEVMKLMNHIKAGVAGTVVGILVENGRMVEYDQPLFVIERETKKD